MDFNTSLSQLPGPSTKRIALRISPSAERGAPGDLTVIFDDAHARRFLAIGLYDPTSLIRVRILQSREPATINADWFQNKLAIADPTRRQIFHVVSSHPEMEPRPQTLRATGIAGGRVRAPTRRAGMFG